MRSRILTRSISFTLAALATVVAAEYHGEVKFAGLPLPGVTVTATQGDKTLTAATDPRGVYSFADLPHGHWSLRAEKLGFEGVSEEVTVVGDSPGASSGDLPLADQFSQLVGRSVNVLGQGVDS